MAITKKQPLKKATASKKQPKAKTPVWSTIHIFGYGESQVMGINLNRKTANSELKALAPLLAALAAQQQKGTILTLGNAYAINIFNDAFIDFLPNEPSKNKQQRFAWSDIDHKAINKLASEILKNVSKHKEQNNCIGIPFKNGMPALEAGWF